MNLYDRQGFPAVRMVGIMDGYKFFFYYCILKSSMNEIILIGPEHLGQIRGSTSYIFLINCAQVLENSFGVNADSETDKTFSSLPAFFLSPLHRLL